MSEQSSIISREEFAIEEVVGEDIYVVKPVVVSAGWLVDEEVVVQELEVEEIGKGEVVEGEVGEL